MDGSEPGEVTPAAVLSGAPVELQARVARYHICPFLSFLFSDSTTVATLDSANYG